MTYGFVKFQHARDAENAVKELNGREVNGKKIKVSYARRGLDASNSKIFVKRLPPLYTFGDVHSLFSQVLMTEIHSYIFHSLVKLLKRDY